MLISPAFAQTVDGSTAGMAMQFAPLVLIFAVFYFLMIRPQQKRMRTHKSMLAALKRGDKVVTQGGILGQVTRVKEGVDEVEVEIAPNVRVGVLRSSITEVLQPVPANDAKAATPAAKS